LELVFGDNATKLLFTFVKGRLSNVYSVRLDLANGTLNFSTPLLIGQVLHIFFIKNYHPIPRWDSISRPVTP
jgi:hypothetical protein